MRPATTAMIAIMGDVKKKSLSKASRPNAIKINQKAKRK